jgi:CRISPR-associated protein (TIGR03986 family)
MKHEKKPCDPRRISAEVGNAQRAGRAPYNFVPLTETKWKAVSRPPLHDAFAAGTHSGMIEIDLKAMTDFYLRGMWPIDQFISAKEDKPVQRDPFQVHGKLRLPGTSLRGLLRTLVEIMSGSPMDDFINNSQLFFRTVASVDEPQNMRSFEPQAKAYKDRLLTADRQNRQLKVRAGYIFGGQDGWYIKPASLDAQKKQYYRYRTSDTWMRRRVSFVVNGEEVHIHDQGREKGWLVCSGSIPGKKKQWVIREATPDSQSDKVTIQAYDVQAYKDGGISREIRKNGFEFNDRSQGVPCFYTDWSDHEGKLHISFGHTPYFRLPYISRPQDAIPGDNSRKDRKDDWDMARAIFGWVSRTGEKKAVRGRIAVEDGILISGPSEPLRKEIHRTVLGQPKPTTYQHYLVQPSDQLARIIHWDGAYNNDNCSPIIRGHKLYWHRPGARIPQPQEGKSDSVATYFRPAAKDAVFRARIRYDNLRLEELGALLAAIQLPKDCAHHLGMGKPLGLGSFEVTMHALKPIDRLARYRSFMDGSGKVTSGAIEAQDLGSEALAHFASWYSGSKTTLDELWKTPRFQQLKALLTFSAQQHTEDWWNMTRYLEFGRLPEGNYNEYLQVMVPGQPRPLLQKRRPLPPASQVLQGGTNIPKNPSPFQPAKAQQQKSSR